MSGLRYCTFCRRKTPRRGPYGPYWICTECGKVEVIPEISNDSAMLNVGVGESSPLLGLRGVY